MGLYKFDESEFTIDYWNAITKIAGSRKNGRVCFVDVEEAELELNRKKGITKPGWWYIEKVVRGDLIKYRVIALSLMTSHKINNRLALNSNENSITEDDTLVVDGDYDIFADHVFASGPTAIWRGDVNDHYPYYIDKEYIIFHVGLVNHGDIYVPETPSLTSIKDDGALISICDVNWVFDFQVKELPKDGSNNNAPWTSLQKLDTPIYCRDGRMEIEIGFRDFVEQQEHKVNDYKYRLYVENDIGSTVGISEVEFENKPFSIDYDINIPYTVQSGDLVDSVATLDLFMYENGTSTFNVEIHQERITGPRGIGDSITRTDMKFPHIGITGTRKAVNDRTRVGQSAITFAVPDGSPAFKVADDGLRYEVTVYDLDSPELWSDGIHTLNIVKRKGFFKTPLPETHVMHVTVDPSTHLLVMDIDVVNDIRRDQPINVGVANGDSSYDLNIKWEYKYTPDGEAEEEDWSPLIGRTLASTGAADATAAVGNDITKIAIDGNRENGVIKLRATAQPGSDFDTINPETTPIVTTSTIRVHHNLHLFRDVSAKYNKKTITSNRRVITNLLCGVGYGSVRYDPSDKDNDLNRPAHSVTSIWQISKDKTEWVAISNYNGVTRHGVVDVNNPYDLYLNTLALSVEDIDVAFAGKPTTVYVRMKISESTYVPGFETTPIEFPVTRS